MELLQAILRLRKVDKKAAGRLTHKPVKAIYQSAIYPTIYVIDKENGGKADSLNAGIEVAEFETIITLDADSTLDVNSLQIINAAFTKDVIAAGGMVHISQAFQGDYKNPQPKFKLSGLVKFQFLQYLSNFYLYKITQAKFKGLAIISGAFGVFQRSALFEVNGYRITVGEDMDITMRIQMLIKDKYPDKKILFIPEAVCFTEGPESFRDLFKQRIRWQKAFIDCIIIYGKSLLTKFGIGITVFLVVDALILGTLTAFPTLITPFIILFAGQGALLAVMLFAFSFSLGIFQSIVLPRISMLFFPVCGIILALVSWLFCLSEYKRLEAVNNRMNSIIKTKLGEGYAKQELTDKKLRERIFNARIGIWLPGTIMVMQMALAGLIIWIILTNRM